MYDVIVIGGNLAGASAAINAAKNGVNVALIERHKEPFNPPHCGEGIADVTGDFLELNKIGCPINKIDYVKIDLSNFKTYKFALTKHKILIFGRYYLEKNLLQQAEKNGVEVFLGKNMRDFKPPYDIILDDNNTLKGKVIIDASGISCHVGKKIGLNTKLKPEEVGVCIQSRVQSTFKENTIHMWYHWPYAPFGYAWLFPKNKTTASIGIGIPGGQKVDLNDLLNSYIKHVTNDDFKILDTFRSCVPSALPLDNLIKNNVMFVGDAARLAKSATGAGIQNAILSGSLAGVIAAKYIKGEIPSLNLYENETKKMISDLKKMYYNKSKLTSDKQYLSAYQRVFSLLNIVNKMFPGFFQNHVAKIMQKDLDIFEKYKV